MKVLRYLAGILITGCVFSSLFVQQTSCVKKTVYPPYPVITFNSLTPFCSGSTLDSVYLRLNFTDGNGDIGYAAQDASAQPDFYARELISYNGTYVPFVIDSDTTVFPYHIPDITPSGKNKSLNGIIQINFAGALFSENELLGTSISGYNFYSIEFQVWIYNRAGIKSNVITTPPVYLLCQ